MFFSFNRTLTKISGYFKYIKRGQIPAKIPPIKSSNKIFLKFFLYFSKPKAKICESRKGRNNPYIATGPLLKIEAARKIPLIIKSKYLLVLNPFSKKVTAPKIATYEYISQVFSPLNFIIIKVVQPTKEVIKLTKLFFVNSFTK